jgi:hypothetical protein
VAEKPPADAADQAQNFSRRRADRLDEYCALRMQELGIPADKLGGDDLRKELTITDGAHRILRAMARRLKVEACRS